MTKNNLAILICRLYVILMMSSVFVVSILSQDLLICSSFMIFMLIYIV